MSKVYFYDEKPVLLTPGAPAHSIYGLSQLSEEKKLILSSNIFDLNEASAIIITKPILSIWLRFLYPFSKIILINVNSNHILSKKRVFFKNYIIKLAYSFCDKIICLSSIQIDKLKNIGLEHKIKVIRLGLDKSFFRPKKEYSGKYFLTAGKDKGRKFDRIISSIKLTSNKLVIVSSDCLLTEMDQVLFYKNLEYSKYLKLLRHSEGLILDIKNEEDSSDCSGSITCLEAILLRKPVFINSQPWLKDLLPGGYFVWDNEKQLLNLLNKKLNSAVVNFPEWMDLDYFKKELISLC